MGIGQVMIFVSSLEVAKRLYCDLLGLEVMTDMSKSAGMLIMRNEGAYLTIHEGFKPSQVEKNQCRIVPIFKVKNIEATVASLKSAGIELSGSIEDSPVHRYQALKDSDGNWIEVAQFKETF